MASRKQQFDVDQVYKITYKSGDKLYYLNVAAVSFVRAIEIFEHTGNSAYSITALEKTDQAVHYGRIV